MKKKKNYIIYQLIKKTIKNKLTFSFLKINIMFKN